MVNIEGEVIQFILASMTTKGFAKEAEVRKMLSISSTRLREMALKNVEITFMHVFGLKVSIF